MQKSYGAIVTVLLSRRCAQSNAAVVSSSLILCDRHSARAAPESSYVWMRVLR
jgi:hypothetical protein